MAEDDDAPWYRSLLTGVGALFGVALLVGGVISLVALGAVSVSGIGEETRTVQEDPSLYIPDRTPGGSEDGDDDPGLTLEDLNGGVDPTKTDEPGATKAPDKAKEKKRRPPRSVISLSVSPLDVAAMERIYLTGTYPGGEGASLQVQRFENGGWTDFPTSASVSGGTFTTYVMTGQAGVNKFRVVDAGRGKASNPVTVRVG